MFFLFSLHPYTQEGTGNGHRKSEKIFFLWYKTGCHSWKFMDMNELIEDLKLKIHTRGSDYSIMDTENYGYDPTPYAALKKPAESGEVTKEDTLVDFGCGKGRVGIYLHEHIGCKIIGVDYSWKRIDEAQENLKRYGETDEICFVHASAEQFDPGEGTCFYFFNPFALQVFEAMIRSIAKVQHETGKNMKIFFYYPTKE